MMRDGEMFFTASSRTHHGDFFDPRPAFIVATIPKSIGHYAAPENQLLADLVYAEILKLPSWRAFVSSARE